MTLSGFGKDEILRTLAWRPIAVAAMASIDNSSPRSSMPPILLLRYPCRVTMLMGSVTTALGWWGSTQCYNIAVDFLAIACLKSVVLPGPVSWQGALLQLGMQHGGSSTREVILGTENGKLHEIAVDEKDKRDKYIKFLFGNYMNTQEAFEGLSSKVLTPTRLYSFTGIGTPERRRYGARSTNLFKMSLIPPAITKMKKKTSSAHLAKRSAVQKLSRLMLQHYVRVCIPGKEIEHLQQTFRLGYTKPHDNPSTQVNWRLPKP
ncbi:hypothetical protein Tco_1196109 [Tanacetum coccineum]